jgi:hypothetical protein
MMLKKENVKEKIKNIIICSLTFIFNFYNLNILK